MRMAVRDPDHRDRDMIRATADTMRTTAAAQGGPNTKLIVCAIASAAALWAAFNTATPGLPWR